MPRVHVTGGSGCGTTTLGKALAAALGARHLDADDFFWLPTTPPFTAKRDKAERNARLRAALEASPSWVLSGSIAGWEVGIEHDFDLVVFLLVPTDLRITRLREREAKAYGAAIQQGGAMADGHREFIAWAERYDTAGLEQRSRATHEAWLTGLACPVLRIEGDTSTRERVGRTLAALDSRSG